MTTTIRVTAAHIKAGKRSQCTACPIALAIKDAVPGMLVAAHPGSVFIGYKSFKTPKVAADFMTAFDALKEVKPFTFQLEEED